ncbi:MAG: ADP-ribosylation factor-like protein [Candidatus Helarchaeota archaeon]
MKISLVGLSGCGKTSIYATTFASKKPEETKQFAPTVMYEIRNHPYLGVNVSFFDFGGQEDYRNSYLEKPEVFKETNVLIPIIDLHDPDKMEDAEKYFKKIVETIKNLGISPEVIIFYHKYDSEGYQKELLDANLKKAKEIFPKIFADFNPKESITSIYETEKLSILFRDILLANYKDIEKHVENTEKQLSEIDAKIIVSDISGNVIVHNVPGISTGLQLRADLRDFISSCNTIRENFFNTDSVKFIGSSKEDKKEINIYIFKYILSVLIMGANLNDQKIVEQLEVLLKDLELFADLVVKAHEE